MTQNLRLKKTHLSARSFVPFFLRVTFLFLAVLLIFHHGFSQRRFRERPSESGGPLIYEQAAYDVLSYSISLEIFPENRSISGSVLITAKIVQPVAFFVVDLEDVFTISKVQLVENRASQELKFNRVEGKIWIKLPVTKQPGELVAIRIFYSGKPRIAPNPPWVGGFVWEKTKEGFDWIGVACQSDGADVWLPVKDHPSDKPNSVSLQITVPKPLYVASNGRLIKVEENANGKRTFYWQMSSPINNYNITINVAPYKLVKDSYRSIDGKVFPIIFYVLPENYEKAKNLIEQTKKFLAFYEKFLGPYPFRSEKLGIAQTPYLGMEHSTIISYGNNFQNNSYGFDWLLLHELGHEWWGNLVTNSDWRDFWLHEGFQSFMDTLYVEEIQGKKAYFEEMQKRVKRIRNKQPVAPREPKFAYQVYMAEPDYTSSDGDIYDKGAIVLHTLRFLVGDEAFFRSLRKMAYPIKKMETITDGTQVRFATTDDFKHIVETESGMDLDWFFEVYLRQPELPKLIVEKTETGKTKIYWETPKNLSFPMPIEIEIEGKIQKFQMKKAIEISQANIKVDPKGWILKEEEYRSKTSP
ncbi:MAG: aminopeptidase [Pyrinomonadaceae bacterium]|nr:MAG: aminopeptidase [Pyrinomonadaceae bacterium]